MKMRPIVVSFTCVAVGIVGFDFLGLLPSLPRTLGACKAEAAMKLAELHRYDDKPIDDPRNIEWYGKHADMLTACMESRGYMLDEAAVAKHVLQIQQATKAEPSSINYAEDGARELQEFWHHRWFWE